ncbi:iron-siderophore ABC transporter substrate-binding protein [Actinomycetospora sp. CA-084318]|uniref:iron-siderophore ABC transporter substrate-binding protein n=1 Tax=Actinomycetospora sp. CA-084318 TaxID=3239892 RepID=UPI003D95CC17
MSHRRRPFVALLLGLVAALVLSACGGGPESGTAASSAPAAPGFPVTINHKFGSTTIPNKPVRVVTVGYNDVDFALALGVVPVGERQFLGSFDAANRPWAQQALGGQRPELVGGNQIDVEKVASLRPDLILGVYSYMERADYDALSRIAPTIADPQDGVAVPWQEQTRITGQALGESARADQVIASVEQRFTDAKNANPQFAGKTVAVDLTANGSTNSLGTDDLRTQPFTGLGLQVAPTTRELSSEQLGELNKDALAVFGTDEAGARTIPTFNTLPVVQQGRVAFLGGETSIFAGAVGFGSPLSLPYAIDAMVPPLAQALR